MKNTIIHIGFPKTGSTFLQNFLFSKMRNWKYLCPPFTQHHEQWNKLQYGDDTQFHICDFHIAKFTNNIDNVLISDENLCGKPIYHGMQRTQICMRLKNIFPEAKILIIIRGQFEMLKSLHNQWVKGARKGGKTFGDFIWFKREEYFEDRSFSLNNMYFNTNSDYLHLDYLNYYDLLKLYKSNFQKVKVLPYEALKSDHERFLKEIVDFCGFKNIITVPQKNINKSLNSNELISKIIENNLEGLHLSKVEKKVVKLKNSNRLMKKNQHEYVEVKRIIQNYYAESNQKIVSDYPEIDLSSFKNEYFL